MILNISPRFVWERSEDDSDELIIGKPHLYTYREEMRCRELDAGYNGRWLE